MNVTIYHNPKCGTSRKVLAAIREAGIEPEIVQYVVDPPSKERLRELLRAMKMEARDLLRRRGTPYDELGLGDPSLSEEQILDAMMAHPILIERPVVVSDKGVCLCRPVEKLFEIL